MTGSVGRRLLLAAAMIVLQFGLFEAALRYQGGSEASPTFQQLFMPDEAIGYRLRPGAAIRFATPEFTTDIAISAQGVRDELVPSPKPADERRIVVLGDSIVLAVQVEAHETFTARLQERLNREGRSRYRVVNAGVQGYGPPDELLFFRRVAAAFEPDVVIITIFVANDAIEALDRRWRLDPAKRTAPPLEEVAEQRLRRLVRRSMVAQILRLRVRSAIERLDPGRPAPDRRILCYAEQPPAEIDEAFAAARDVVAQMDAEIRARGARTAIVLVPARFQLDPAELGRVQEMVAADGYTITADGASRRFRQALAPLGIPMLDLLPIFLAAPDPGAIFFESTVHLTPAGHRLTADAIARFLESEGLLP